MQSVRSAFPRGAWERDGEERGNEMGRGDPIGLNQVKFTCAGDCLGAVTGAELADDVAD
ncbi:MAG: hypothetical protein GY943_30215, partial [Chloroflexi bacterium]|nr:hypothetical protein [Chloroflexota bacterium]